MHVSIVSTRPRNPALLVSARHSWRWRTLLARRLARDGAPAGSAALVDRSARTLLGFRTVTALIAFSH